jgi:hypothetical protein
MFLAPAIGPQEAAGLHIGMGTIGWKGIDDLAGMGIDLGAARVEMPVLAAPDAYMASTDGHYVGGSKHALCFWPAAPKVQKYLLQITRSK